MNYRLHRIAENRCGICQKVCDGFNQKQSDRHDQGDPHPNPIRVFVRVVLSVHFVVGDGGAGDKLCAWEHETNMFPHAFVWQFFKTDFQMFAERSDYVPISG